MTEGEVYRNWKLSKDPNKQVRILADINEVSRSYIEAIIEKYTKAEEFKPMKNNFTKEQDEIITNLILNKIPRVEIAQRLGLEDNPAFRAHYYYVKKHIDECVVLEEKKEQKKPIAKLNPIHCNNIVNSPQPKKQTPF